MTSEFGWSPSGFTPPPPPKSTHPTASCLCVCPLYHPSSLEKVQQPSGQFIHRHERGHKHLFDRVHVCVCVCAFPSGQLTPSLEIPPHPNHHPFPTLKAVYLSATTLLYRAATCCCHGNRQHPPHRPLLVPLPSSKASGLKCHFFWTKHTRALRCDSALSDPQRVVIRDNALLKNQTRAPRARTGTWCIECSQTVTKEWPCILFISCVSCQILVFAIY